ncbi:MAG: hypothetical protein JO172_09030 [Hyphomicrobiales bacterium]|nr:hypothetical protein [Hyphomicrobiales bacterium]
MAARARELRIALAGFGAWGRVTAKALAAIEGTRIVSIYCHGEASELAAREQLPRALRFNDYGEMLRSAPADVVCVTVPNIAMPNSRSRRSGTAPMCSSKSRSACRSRNAMA